MSVTRTVQFGLYALDGSPQTGETHGTDWQAYYTVNGGAPVAVADADTAEVGDGLYTASVTADADDVVLAWATYTDTETQTGLTATGRVIGPWVETPDVPTAQQLRQEMDANSTRLDEIDTQATAAATAALTAAQKATTIEADYQQRGVAVTLPEEAPSGWGLDTTGNGANTVTITVTDGTDPLQNATVTLSEGTNRYTGKTGADGHVTFNVDSATYTVAIIKSGYTFGGASLIVGGDMSQTYNMGQNAVTPAADPDKSNGTLTAYDINLQPASGIVFQVLLVQTSNEPTAGRSFSRQAVTVNSGTGGMVSATCLRGATYRMRRQRSEGEWGAWVEFAVPDSSSFDLPEVLGKQTT